MHKSQYLMLAVMIHLTVVHNIVIITVSLKWEKPVFAAPV